MAGVQIFLSCVNDEFRSYRDTLRADLTRPNVSVAVEEDFIPTGTETLDMLDEYIRDCDAVVHLVGDMTGSPVMAPSFECITKRYPDLGKRLPPLAPFLEPGAPALPYTQWEAWLALYHRKRLILAEPTADAPRDEEYQKIPEQCDAQLAHLERLADVERFPFAFANADRLAVTVLKSKILDILAQAGPTKKHIHLPYLSLGDLFIGRDATLRSLRTSLMNAPATGAAAVVGTALHGLGGVGKSRLAVEYAWRYAENYSALLLIRADAPDALQRNLASLCAPRLLDLPEHSMPDESAQAAAALRWLQSHAGWLLILDNVDSEEAAAAVEALLPELGAGHVLVTARVREWSRGIDALPLDVLPRDDAVAFLLARTDERRRKMEDDEEQAGVLADEIDGLAVALEQAGAYIARQRLTFADYLEQWRSRRDEVLDWHDERVMNYPSSVAVTWQTSVGQLDASARRLLERLSWLATDPIPETLLDVVPEHTEPFDARAALAELEAYSLVTRAEAEPSFAVHRLVQEVTRRGAEEQTLREALTWIDDAFIGDPQDVRSWPTLDSLLPHAMVIVHAADRPGVAEFASRLMSLVALLLKLKVRFDEAEPLCRRALAIDEESFGTEHTTVAIRLNNLAQLLKATNRLSEAEPLMRQALAIDEKSYGDDHSEVATDLNNLAELLHDTDRLSEAEPLMRRALAIAERNYSDEHPRVALHLNNLAQLLQDTNRLSEAESLMRRSLAISEKSYGEEHPNVAIALNNLAQLMQDTDRLSEAEPLIGRALAIVEKSYGDEHPSVAIPLNNLATLLSKTNRLSEAEPLMRRALALDEKSYGYEHPKVAIRLNNLAELLKATNRLSEAEPLIRRALAIGEKSLGDEHPKVAIRLNNLAQLLLSTNRLSEAEPLMRRALTINEKSYGDEHPKFAMSLNALANVLVLTNRPSEAEPLLRRALDILEDSVGPDHSGTQRVAENLAFICEDDGAAGTATNERGLWRKLRETIAKRLGS